MFVGFAIGIFCAKNRAIGVGILSASGGSSFGTILTTILMVTSVSFYWFIMGSCIVMSVGLTCFLKEPETVIITLTSFLGSYSFMKGISYTITGGFWDDKALHALLADGSLTWSTFPKMYYTFVTAVVILTVVGAKI